MPNLFPVTDPLSDVGNPAEVFRDPKQVNFLQSFLTAVRRNLTDAVKQSTAGTGIMLQAPNGAVYQVGVSNVGALTITHIRG